MKFRKGKAGKKQSPLKISFLKDAIYQDGTLRYES